MALVAEAPPDEAPPVPESVAAPEEPSVEAAFSGWSQDQYDHASTAEGGSSDFLDEGPTKSRNKIGEKRNKIGEWTQQDGLGAAAPDDGDWTQEFGRGAGHYDGQMSGAYSGRGQGGSMPPYDRADQAGSLHTFGASAFPMKVVTQAQYMVDGRGSGQHVDLHAGWLNHPDRLQASTQWSSRDGEPPYETRRRPPPAVDWNEPGERQGGKGRQAGEGPKHRPIPNHLATPEEDRWSSHQKGGWPPGNQKGAWPPGSWACPHDGWSGHEKGQLARQRPPDSYGYERGYEKGGRQPGPPTNWPGFAKGGKGPPDDWPGFGKGGRFGGPPGHDKGGRFGSPDDWPGHGKGGRFSSPDNWQDHEKGGFQKGGPPDSWGGFQKGGGFQEKGGFQEQAMGRGKGKGPPDDWQDHENGKGGAWQGHQKGGRQSPPFHSQGNEKAAPKGADALWRTNRWHKSAESVGILAQDDHIFTKVAGPKQQRVHDSGVGYELSTICMVFDASLRCGGVHRYNFTFIEGELGPADGAGFIFDNRVRRRPLQQMRAVFMNLRGYVCLRRGGHVSRLPAQLPRLELGKYLTLSVNLDWFSARFDIINADGQVEGSADVNLESIFHDVPCGEQTRSGFFGAVVTGNVTVGLY